MRDQGRLVEWFDDQGYGFIQPNDPSKDRVFLHIKAFARPGPRPITGCALEYTVTLGDRHGYKALDVVYLKANQVKKIAANQSKSQPKKRSAQVKWIPTLAVIYILTMALCSLLGLISAMVLLVMVFINLLTYWCYAQDKQAAGLDRHRISERNLHLLAFLGGWPAAWLAQQRLRHKTQKATFQKVYLLSIIFNILLMIWWISPLNHLLL